MAPGSVCARLRHARGVTPRVSLRGSPPIRNEAHQREQDGWRDRHDGLAAEQLRIPAKLNARSGDRERRFRASRTLIGA